MADLAEKVELPENIPAAKVAKGIRVVAMSLQGHEEVHVYADADIAEFTHAAADGALVIGKTLKEDSNRYDPIAGFPMSRVIRWERISNATG